MPNKGLMLRNERFECVQLRAVLRVKHDCLMKPAVWYSVCQIPIGNVLNGGQICLSSNVNSC